MVGCIRNFKINGSPAGEPTTNQGVGPCFDGQTDSGSYFSGNGGYVIIGKSGYHVQLQSSVTLE